MTLQERIDAGIICGSCYDYILRCSTCGKATCRATRNEDDTVTCWDECRENKEQE